MSEHWRGITYADGQRVYQRGDKVLLEGQILNELERLNALEAQVRELEQERADLCIDLAAATDGPTTDEWTAMLTVARSEVRELRAALESEQRRYDDLERLNHALQHEKRDAESDKATAVKALREARKAFRQIVQTEEAEGRERLRDIASHAGWEAQAALDAIEADRG